MTWNRLLARSPSHCGAWYLSIFRYWSIVGEATMPSRSQVIPETDGTRQRRSTITRVPGPTKHFAGNTAFRPCLGSKPQRRPARHRNARTGNGGFRETIAAALNFRSWPRVDPHRKATRDPLLPVVRSRNRRSAISPSDRSQTLDDHLSRELLFRQAGLAQSLIPVFFREPQVFRIIRTTLAAKLRDRQAGNGSLRFHFGGHSLGHFVMIRVRGG